MAEKNMSWVFLSRNAETASDAFVAARQIVRDCLVCAEGSEAKAFLSRIHHDLIAAETLQEMQSTICELEK